MFADHSRTGLKKVRHACPEWHLERFPKHAACMAVQIFFNFFCPISICILWSICVCIHISDCLQNVLELLVLTNNTASETLLHKSGAVRSVDCMIIIGASAWRWLSDYVTMDNTFTVFFSNSSSSSTRTSTLSSSSHSSRRPLLEIHSLYFT